MEHFDDKLRGRGEVRRTPKSQKVCYIKYYEIIIHEILGRGWLDSLASPIFDFDAPYLRPTKVSVPSLLPTPSPVSKHTHRHTPSPCQRNSMPQAAVGIGQIRIAEA